MPEKKELVEVLIRIYKHLPSIISAVEDANERIFLQHTMKKIEKNTITELLSLT